MRTYTGKVVAAGVDSLTVEMVTARPPAGGVMHVTLRCSARVAVQAAAAIGQRVRFTAELSELTVDLTHPILVVGSQHGLRAVDCMTPPYPAHGDVAVSLDDGGVL